MQLIATASLLVAVLQIGCAADDVPSAPTGERCASFENLEHGAPVLRSTAVPFQYAVYYRYDARGNEARAEVDFGLVGEINRYREHTYADSVRTMTVTRDPLPAYVSSGADGTMIPVMVHDPDASDGYSTSAQTTYEYDAQGQLSRVLIDRAPPLQLIRTPEPPAMAMTIEARPRKPDGRPETSATYTYEGGLVASEMLMDADREVHATHQYAFDGDRIVSRTAVLGERFSSDPSGTGWSLGTVQAALSYNADGTLATVLQSASIVEPGQLSTGSRRCPMTGEYDDLGMPMNADPCARSIAHLYGSSCRDPAALERALNLIGIEATAESLRSGRPVGLLASAPSAR